MIKSDRKKSIISILLVLTTLITGAFAFLVAKDGKINLFTIKDKQTIVVREAGWYDSDGNLVSDDNGNGVNDFAENLLPGETLSKAPYLESTANSGSRAIAVVKVPLQRTDFNEIATSTATTQLYRDYTSDNSESLFRNLADNLQVAAYAAEASVVDATEDYFRDQLEKDYNLFSTDGSALGCFKTNEFKEKYNEELYTSGSNKFDKYIYVTTNNVWKNINEENFMLLYFDIDKDFENLVLTYEYDGIIPAKGTTEPLFESVTIDAYFNTLNDISKGTDYIGENVKLKMSKLVYYAPNDNDAAIEASKLTPQEVKSCSAISGYTPIEIDEVICGSSVEMLMNSCMYKTGCTFDWVDAETGEKGYSGMTIDKNTNLLGVNTDISDGKETAGYLIYSFNKNGAILKGAIKNAPDFPTEPTTVVIPEYIYIRVDKQTNMLTMENGNFHGSLSKEDNAYSYNFDAIKNEYIDKDNVYKVPVTGVSVVGNTDYGETDEYPANALVSIAKKLVIPNSVTNIKYNGCYLGETNYSVLEEINIPFECQYLGATDVNEAGNRSISTGLYNNPHLSSISLPNTLKIIGYNCFAKTSISELVLPESIEIIGPDILRFTNVSEITVPSSVTYIMNHAFNEVNTVKFESTNWKFRQDGWDEFEYLGCSNIEFNCTLDEFKQSDAYRTLHFADGLLSYNSLSFSDITLNQSNKINCSVCSRERWEPIPCVCMTESVLYDENEILYISYYVSTVIIKEGVTAIPYHAFAAHIRLQEVVIPSTVTTIEANNIFSYSCNVSSITIDKKNSVYDSRDNCNAIIETSTNTLLVGCKDTVIPNTVAKIARAAFYRVELLTNITIPNSVSEIANYAFGYCKNLKSVTYGGITYTSKSALIDALNNNGVIVGDFVFNGTGLSD